MGEHFVDRLQAAIAERRAPVCVGVDPRFDRLPAELREGVDSPAGRLEAIGRFCQAVIDAVAEHVPAVKPQSAYFEAYGSEGVAVYEHVVRYARRQGLLVIGDVKRNDIGSTAEAYAVGHLRAADAPDAITVNGYLGGDGLMPFVDAAAETGRGVFALVRTSNPSAGQVQDFADAEGARLYENVAMLVAELGAEPRLIGQGGYSVLGAVVGATWVEEARRLRERMPRQFFLVPGYGAQGASAEDCRAAFAADGSGAIVNASRSVIYAQPEDGRHWRAAIETAARDFASELRQAVGL